MPIKIDGVYEVREFSCAEDVWEVIDLLIQETKSYNEQGGKEFDIAKSVKAQLPFFCCNNVIQDKYLQRDIRRYLYCEQFNVPPFSGSFDDQPVRWIDKAFIIKNALAKLNKDKIEWHSHQSNKE